MNFTKDDIQQYQQLSREHFQEEIDESTAEQELADLVTMVGLIYRPYTKEVLRQLQQRIETWSKRGQPADSSDDGSTIST